jgi:hypothetical protein
MGGLGSIPTFGEVFTAPAGNTLLSSFSFYLGTNDVNTFSGSQR